MKRRISILLAAVLTLGSTAVGMAAITFSDINNVPWDGAKTYITQVSDLGLMVGEEFDDGTNVFRANDKVTYCETVQLIYNLLKSDGKASDSTSRITKWENVMGGYNIPEWAYQAIAYALEEGIISMNDLSTFVSANGNGNNTTREDVAVIFGKALSDDYRIEEDPDLTFSDRNNISSDARPYVALLSDLNILIGDDDKNFNPKNQINRAEMAVVVVKTYTVMSGGEIETPKENNNSSSDNGSTVKGTINNLTTEKIIINKNSGGSAVYNLANKVEMTLNGDDASVNQIMRIVENGVDVDVTVTLLNNEAVNIEAEGEENTVYGYITDMTNDKVEIKRSGGTARTYYFAYDVIIKYDGETVRVKDLMKDVDNGVEIEVTATLDDDLEITRIEANVSTVGGKVTGGVKKMTDSKITLYLPNGSTQSYTISDEAVATYEGSSMSISRLADKVEDGTDLSATIYLNSNKHVSKIVAELDDNSKGVITALTNSSITVKSNSGTEKKYQMDSDVVVKYNTGTTENVKHLIEIYEKNKTEVVLTLNRNGIVTRISVDIDDDDYDIVNGDVVSMESDSIKIGSKTVKMNSSTKITLDGEDISVSQLYARYEKGEEFSGRMSYADNVAKTLALTLDSVEGRITNMLNGKITVSSKNGTGTYDVADAEDLTVRIDGAKDNYTFIELYSRWNLSGIQYDVKLTFKDGEVIRITAESV